MPRTAAHNYAKDGNLSAIEKHLKSSPNDIHVVDDHDVSFYLF